MTSRTGSVVLPNADCRSLPAIGGGFRQPTAPRSTRKPEIDPWVRASIPGQGVDFQERALLAPQYPSNVASMSILFPESDRPSPTPRANIAGPSHRPVAQQGEHEPLGSVMGHQEGRQQYRTPPAARISSPE
jgi:hypothetical protein